jgi:hypothetical protein
MLIAETTIDRYYFNDSIVTFFRGGDEKDLSEKILLLAANKNMLDEQVLRANEFVKDYNWEIKKSEYLSLVDRK